MPAINLETYLRIEKEIQRIKLDELYAKYGDEPPYHEEVLVQRGRYFQISDMLRQEQERKLFSGEKEV